MRIGDQEKKVRDLLSKIPLEDCLSPGMTFADALKKILESRRFNCTGDVCDVEDQVSSMILKGLPVLDADVKPVGFLSALNIFEILVPGYLKEDKSLASMVWSGMLLDQAKEHQNALVEDIMTKDPIVVKEDDSLMSCVLIFVQKHIQRVMVVDNDGVFVGVVFGRDVLREVAEFVTNGGVE